MTVLDDYNAFDGRHWETGTIGNFMAYRGFTAPHTGEPYSEALLLGVSGGAVMGYFSFDYEGFDPMARILTRNTYDPLDTMLSRLGVVQNRVHTASPEKGRANLLDTLREGVPAIVWADMYSLPYNGLGYEEKMWVMFPVLIFGHDEAADRVWIADRARVPLHVTPEALHRARARVKKDKFRVLTVDAPVAEKVPAAVRAGIWDCIKLYTEKPPKGSKNSFGLAALRWWAEQLRNPRARTSWEKVFPAGPEMLAGLTSAFHDINLFGKGEEGVADRPLYADFLEEAAVILSKPTLNDAAALFRECAGAWRALSTALLPDEVEPFRETRELMVQRHRLFLNRGNDALEEMVGIDARLNEIKAAVTADFPLNRAEVDALRERIAGRVMAIHDVESEAVAALREAMTAG